MTHAARLMIRFVAAEDRKHGLGPGHSIIAGRAACSEQIVDDKQLVRELFDLRFSDKVLLSTVADFDDAATSIDDVKPAEFAFEEQAFRLIPHHDDVTPGCATRAVIGRPAVFRGHSPEIPAKSTNRDHVPGCRPVLSGEAL